MWRIFEDPHKLELPKPEDALPGRASAMPVSSRHFVSGAPLTRPFSRGPGASDVRDGVLLGRGRNPATGR